MRNSYIAILKGRIKKLIKEFREQKKASEDQLERLRNSVADLTGALRDSQREREHAEFLSQHDEATSLYNRRAFIGLVDDFLHDLGKSDQRVNAQSMRTHCLVFLDVVKFKKINDESGHQYGDAALRMVADSLRANLRKHHDIYCRWGGDEFLIFFPTMTPKELALVIAKLNIDMAMRDSRLRVRYGASYYTPGDDYDRMIGRADEDLLKKYKRE